MKKTIVELLDDLDGSEAFRTVQLGLDGQTYELDLSVENVTRLQETLRPYMEHGRKVTKTGKPIHRVAVTNRDSTTNREFRTKVREWANAHGYSVPDRGRIPGEVYDAYGRAQALREARPALAEQGTIDVEGYGSPKKVQFQPPADD